MSTSVTSASSASASAADDVDATLAADGPVATPPQIGRGTEIGRYLILGELGRGAMSRVYAAYDVDLDRKLALKLVNAPIGADDERRRALLREAQAMAKIRHPNVVAVHDVGTHDDRLYVAMEFVEGTTLGQWCAAPGRTPDEILDAYVEAASGLAAAHAAGVVHRDFKPDNVLVDADGTVRVADFGLAQPGGAADRGPGGPAGTPAYMSPEHYVGGQLDARSDQFSFCVALFEALWGERPFRGATLGELASATIEGRMSEPKHARVTRRMRDVVRRGLSPQPGSRHASMDALVVALTRARRRRWPRMLAASFAVVALGGAAWAMAVDDAAPVGCLPGAELVAGVWDSARREGVTLRDASLADGYVRDAEVRLRAALDEYGAAWAGIYDEVCPTLLDAPPSDTLAGARRACLDDRLAALGGLVEFVGAQPVSPLRVESLVDTLSPAEECTQPDVAQVHPVPADPEAAQEVRSLRKRLRELRLTLAWDETAAALADLDAIAERAAVIGQTHLRVAALNARAVLLYARGDQRGVEQSLDTAVFEAIAAGHDALAIDAIATRVLRARDGSMDPPMVERWFELGMALVRRSGDDPSLRARMLLARGMWMSTRRDFRAALASNEGAAQAFEAAFGRRSREVGMALSAQGMALASLFEFDAAHERLVEAAAVLEDADNRQAPMMGVLQTAAYVAMQRGDRIGAADLYARSLALAREILGDRGRALSSLYYNTALFEAESGHPDAASEAMVRSRSAWPVVGDVRGEAEFALGEALLAEQRGADREALLHAEQALAIYAAIPDGGPGPALAARVLEVGALTNLGAYDAALDIAEQAYAAARGLEENAAAEVRGLSRKAIEAALARGDMDTAVVWSIRLDARAAAGHGESLAHRFAHLLLRDPRDPDAVAAATRDREQAVRFFHERHPLVLQYDAWLRGEHPAIRGAVNAPRSR